jgi:hypothetical protein
MALTQTLTAKNLSSGQVIEPQLILEIDGVTANGENILFGTSDVLIPLRFDEIPPFEFDESPSLKFDSPVVARNSRAYISWKQTTKSIKSQLLIDKGGAGSIQNFKVQLVNKANEVSGLFTSGNLIQDIFGQRVELYLNYQGGIHPTDSSLIFQGVIKGVEQDHGNIILDIAHPDQFKRQELFENNSTRLNGAIDNSQTTITVDSTNDFVIPTATQQANGFKAYVKIDDEYIETQSSTTTTFTGLRNQLESSAAAHDDNADVVSHYRLTAQPIEMMLRLMLSDSNQSDYLTHDVSSFIRTNSNGDITNAIYFQGVDVIQKYQVIAGDTISSTGATNAANNFTDRTITEVVKVQDGSYIVVDGAELVLETASSAEISILSQFNLYPIGLGMLPKDIDMAAVLETKDEVDLGLPEISIDISEETNVKEFMESQLAKPNALYFIPSARVSVKFTRPPLASENLVTLDDSVITNITSLKLKRTFGKYFYNTVTYAYEYNPVKEKYEDYSARVNSDSLSRVGLGRKSLKIEANGFRSGGAVQNVINNISSRILDRYKFGARYISGLKVAWRVGNTIEIGDVVNLNDIKIPDLEKGTTTIENTLFEVTNITRGIKDGSISLDLLETNFSGADRFATTSPSTNIVEQISSTSLRIAPSFSTSGSQKEKDKWTDYLGGKVQIHNIDYTSSQILTLIGFNPQNDNEAQFLETITVTPDNMVMDFAPYNECNEKQKLLHTFIGPSIQVTSGTSNFIFDAPVANLFEGATMFIRRADFTESIETTIIDITGTTITVEDDLGFTPDSTDRIEGIGFNSDNGTFYRFV